MGDVRLSITTDLAKASTDVRYRNALVDYEVLPTMTGFGISYIFSVITAALWCTVEANKDSILIIENPEAHLHPAAQSRVGKFLQLISSVGVQVIIETHSEHVIDGARLQAAYSEMTEDMQVFFFQVEDKRIAVKEITVNKNGELSEWPKGFFDQKSQDLRDLLFIRRRNANKELLNGLIFIHKLPEVVRVLHNTARTVLVSISNDIKWKEKNQVFPEDFFQRIVWEVNGFGMIENTAVVSEVKVY